MRPKSSEVPRIIACLRRMPRHGLRNCSFEVVIKCTPWYHVNYLLNFVGTLVGGVAGVDGILDFSVYYGLKGGGEPRYSAQSTSTCSATVMQANPRPETFVAYAQAALEQSMTFLMPQWTPGE